MQDGCSEVQNCRRHVTSFEISPCDLRFKGHQLCAIKIKGSAFLLHQVCCMVAVLLMIGQGLESPDAGTIPKQHSAYVVYNFEKIPQVSSFHLGDFESQTRSANKSTGCMIGIVSNSCCIA
ncbi:uncharacterized protein LOC7464786 [Populus trichocarpa]|uniref:uncharacterized protein LOC7464786 n=1 Tax=Populus trichocarpa TaxID=3694 RepID=UPI0022793F81|nr:uncharacterized protein LOC7464786 [Populus trichocarpa]